jgi:predicted deacylase
METVVQGCTHGIDLHAGSNHRANLPQIRAAVDDSETLRLAKAFKVPVIINAKLREGSLRKTAADMGITTLIYEAGEALRFDEVAIRAGMRGIMSVMQVLQMLKSQKGPVSEMEPLIVDTTSWVRASASGILRMSVPLGGRVTRNAKIGEIVDPFGGDGDDIRSPVSGMVIGRLNLPLVHRGDAVVHIAHLERLKAIDPVIKEFQEEIVESVSSY